MAVTTEDEGPKDQESTQVMWKEIPSHMHTWASVLALLLTSCVTLRSCLTSLSMISSSVKWQ